MQAHLLDIWKNVDITVVFITHDLDEAIFLADRILVLKPHPGEVQEIIEVPVPRPRHADQMSSAEFQLTRARLDELIHHKHEEAEEEPGINPHIIRFTVTDDNVE
jgi:NitT/TauT family transport system ATP-binding protein